LWVDVHVLCIERGDVMRDESDEAQEVTGRNWELAPSSWWVSASEPRWRKHTLNNLEVNIFSGLQMEPFGTQMRAEAEAARTHMQSSTLLSTQ
jgi:hypothetical protein